MQDIDKQALVIIISAVALLIILALIMLFFAVYYSNKKRRLIKEKELLKANYDHAILHSQLEIQEQTLRNVSKEIHDNIGQVLSYVSLSLDRAINLKDSDKNGVIAESKTLINQSMGDLRDLSKSFSLDNIIANGLVETVRAEINRLNRSQLIDAGLEIEGDIYRLGENNELVLYRILQEFINNTLKHAKAKQISIGMTYNTGQFIFNIADNGGGFNGETQQNKGGSGLKNMRSRAEIIGAEVSSGSELGKGTWLKILLKQDIKPNGKS